MSQLPPLKTLPAFVAVAQNLSFTQAAAQLHVTHSAVSQSIRQLETYLQVTLFDRESGRNIELTQEGKRYFYEIERALGIIAKATAAERVSSADNMLTVNVLTTLTMHWLIPRLADFYASHTDIDLRLSTLGVDFDLIQNKIDMAVMYGVEGQWPKYYCEKLFDDQLVLVAGAQIANENKSTKKLLDEHKAIYVDSELREQDWKAWCNAAGLKQPDRSKRIYFQGSSSALQAVSAGMGVMVTHKPFIVSDIASGQLCLISNVEAEVDKSYYLVAQKDTLRFKKARIFRDWLIAQIQASKF